MRGLIEPREVGTASSCDDRRQRCSLAVTRLLPAALLACLVWLGFEADVATGGYVDAYEQLQNYGFPVGLLPHTVTGYELNENGRFAVYLESKCQIDIPAAFPVVYGKKISGQLSYGSLRGLSGVQVKIVYFWVSITAITVKGDDLCFEVGIISASYPIHPNFDESPECLAKLEQLAIAQNSTRAQYV